MKSKDLFRGNLDIKQLPPFEARKHFFKKSVIKYLYFNGPLSNPAINRKTNISSPTIIRILNELILDDFVQKIGREISRGGRRPNLYKLKKNCFFVLGVDMGRYKTRMAIYNNDNESITKIKYCPIILSNSIKLVDEIYEHSTQLIKSSGIDSEKLMGIGIGMPGLID